MEMTITRALAEVKSLDARISTAYGKQFVGIKKKPQQIINGRDVKDILSEFQSNYDSLKDMIDRRHKIKKAVVLSNATTKVNVAGNEMTVAEAIDYKNSIRLDVDMLNTLKKQYANTLNSVNTNNTQVDRMAEQEANQAFGSKQKSDNNAYTKFVEDYKDRNYFEVVDAISIKEKIDVLEKKIEEFNLEVDFVLSESNAMTKIDV